MPFKTSTLTAIALAALLSSHQATAHSWNEQLVVISDNGSFTGAYGYPRGYVARTDPSFTGESDKYQLPSLESGRTYVNTSDLLCHPAQRSPVQTANFPRLQASPGSWVAFRQLENGHVTIPENQPGKPDNRGTVYVYATTEPKQDEKLTDVVSWTQDGSGGDKRGRLIGMNDFDDLRCHQMNDHPISIQRQVTYSNPVPGQPGTKTELWCETDIQIPKDPSFVTVGKPLTVYWIWDWPYLPGSPGMKDGKQEWYTTCSDIDIVDTVQPPKDGSLKNTLVQQDPMTLAVEGYQKRTVNPKYTVPSYFTWSVSGSPPPPAPTNGGSGSGAAAFVASSTSSSASISASASASGPSSGSITSPTIVQGSASPSISSQSASTTSITGTGSVVTAIITVVATLAPGDSVTTVSGTHVIAFTAGAQSPSISSSSSIISTSSGFVKTTITVPAFSAASPVSTAPLLGLSAVQIGGSSAVVQSPGAGGIAQTTSLSTTPMYRRRSAKFGRL